MIPNYRRLKEKRLVQLRAHGSEKVSVVAANFDSSDKTRLDDTVEISHIRSFRAERDALAQDIETRKANLDDLDALIADAEAADAQFNESTPETVEPVEAQQGGGRMKLQLRKLIDSYNDGSLDRLKNDKHLPLTTSFSLSSIIRQTDDHFRDFDKERNKLVEKHGGKAVPEIGRYVFPDDAKSLAFNKEIDPLLNKEIEIVGKQLTLKDFQPRAINSDPFLSISDLASLDWLIVIADESVVPVAKEKEVKE